MAEDIVVIDESLEEEKIALGGALMVIDTFFAEPKLNLVSMNVV
jgi:hypothetical protein